MVNDRVPEIAHHVAGPPAAVLGRTLLLFALAACGDTSGPSAVEVRMVAPAAVRGTLEHPDDNDQRLRFTCQYTLTPSVRSDRGVLFRTARYEIISSPEAYAPFRYTGTMPPSDVTAFFNPLSIPLTTGSTAATVPLRTWVDFPVGPEPRGSAAAHTARWTFGYTVDGRADSVAVDIGCLPMVTPRVQFEVWYLNGSNPIPGATVTFAGRTTRTDTRGIALIDSVVFGAYQASVRALGYLPKDTTMFADENVHPFILMRAP